MLLLHPRQTADKRLDIQLYLPVSCLDRMNTIRAYVCKYGLLGIINALPSTWEFAKHDRFFLPKNLFFRDEVMDTPEYIDKFFPFEKHVFKIRDDKPEYATGVSLPTLKEYGEKYDWLEKVFKDWGAVMLCTSTYAQDMWDMDKDELELLQSRCSRNKSRSKNPS